MVQNGQNGQNRSENWVNDAVSLLLSQIATPNPSVFSGSSGHKSSRTKQANQSVKNYSSFKSFYPFNLLPDINQGTYMLHDWNIESFLLLVIINYLNDKRCRRWREEMKFLSSGNLASLREEAVESHWKKLRSH